MQDFSHVCNVERNENCVNFNEDLSKWNMSAATNLNSMFLGCEKFQGNGVDKWDVSNVKTMVGTFESCTSFDQNLSAWDTRKLVDLAFLFARSGFKGNGVENWSTSLAYNMSFAFFGLSQMDVDFSSWDTSNVVDMSFMVSTIFLTCFLFIVPTRESVLTLIPTLQFNECSQFTGKGLQNFDTSNVRNMAQM